MSPASKPLRLFLASCLIAIPLAALAPAASSAGDSVYAMHRSGLRVRLEVRGREISSTRIWFRQRCSDGFEGGSALILHGPHQGIHIDSSGRFDFKWITGGGYWRRIKLRGRVHDRTITGSFLAWERQGSSGVVCGTGRPGDRTLRFTARR